MNGYCTKEQDITITHGLTTPLPCFEPDAKEEEEEEEEISLRKKREKKKKENRIFQLMSGELFVISQQASHGNDALDSS